MTCFLRSFAVAVALFVVSVTGVQAATIPLYQDNLGTKPGDQPWLFHFGIGGSVTETAVTSGATTGVNLVTDDPASAGYSNYRILPPIFENPAFPALDRSLGFSLSFELQVNSEAHQTDDRAGFSVILLADDSLGIELGFWTTEVWAQNVGFIHAESEDIDTVSAEVLYELSILGSGYILTADGNPLLSGGLRDYSGVVSPLDPYALPSYLYLGDNTGSARADITVGNVTLQTNMPSVPAPAAWLLMLSGLGLLVRLRRFNRVRGAPA